MEKCRLSLNEYLNTFWGPLVNVLFAHINCIRKITTEEKRNIGLGFLKLSPDDLQKVLGIVAQADSSFQPRAEEVNIEMDVLVNLLLKPP